MQKSKGQIFGHLDPLMGAVISNYPIRKRYCTVPRSLGKRSINITRHDLDLLGGVELKSNMKTYAIGKHVLLYISEYNFQSNLLENMWLQITSFSYISCFQLFVYETIGGLFSYYI